MRSVELRGIAYGHREILRRIKCGDIVIVITECVGKNIVLYRHNI